MFESLEFSADEDSSIFSLAARVGAGVFTSSEGLL